MDYVWDEEKNQTNFKKHGIWFEEAATVFSDKNALEAFDSDNSFEGEERFVTLGLSSNLRLLIVVSCEVIDGQTRIISARKATKKEGESYEKRIRLFKS